MISIRSIVGMPKFLQKKKKKKKKKQGASYSSFTISDCVKDSDLNHAFALYKDMQESGIFPSPYDLVALLKACSMHKDMEKGQMIHFDLSNTGLIQSNAFIGSTLINMYAKCGLLLEAEEVFDHLIVRNIVSWNALVSGYVEYDCNEKVFQCLDRMRGEGIFPDAITLVSSLKSCCNIGSMVKAQEIYTEVIHNQSLKRDIFIGNTLVDMFAKYGFFDEAEQLFANLPHRDIVSWNALISGYAEHGHSERALSCLDQMQDEGISPDGITLVCGLKACGTMCNTRKGEEMHIDITRKGLLEKDAYIGSALIYMYIRCGLLATAHHVFETLPRMDIVTWNVLIAGYVENGNSREALSCVAWMEAMGTCTDSATVVSILKACSSTGDLYNGQDRHIEIVRKGFDVDIYVGSTLVDMYARCGSLEEARKVFENLPDHITVAWNALIGGYAEHGHSETASIHFEEMVDAGIRWDAITIMNALKACGNMRTLSKGQEIHSMISKAGVPDRDSFVGSTLIDMYAKCDMLLEARYMFEKLVVQDEVSWTALLSGYIENGLIEEALGYCEQMQSEQGVMTANIVLKACGSLKAIDKGREMHAKIVQFGCLEAENLTGGNSLVDMYMKCGYLLDAEAVFGKLYVRDEASWTALITGYSDRRAVEETFRCFDEMKREGISPGTLALASMLRVCDNLSSTGSGREMHGEIIGRGLESEPLIGNALLEMYSKDGFIEEAAGVFDRIREPDVVSWTTMIAAYNESGKPMCALDCFERMQYEGVLPSCATFASILKAHRSMLEWEEVYSEVVKKGLETSTHLGNTLLDMYAKCGLLAEAGYVFDKLHDRTITSWNTLISGYAETNRHGQEAIKRYERVQDDDDLTPDKLMLVGCLKACGSLGAMEKGQEVHTEAVKKGLEMETMVGNSLVDMYIKCGYLAIARKAFDKIPCRDVVSWTMLIAGYVEKGQCLEALDHVERMECESVVAANAVTLVCTLRACGIVGASAKGREIHADMLKKGFLRHNDDGDDGDDGGDDDELVGTNALLDMYAKCGLLLDAQEMFDKAMARDLVSWNTLIGGYSQLGRSEAALETLRRMVSEGIRPNAITFVGVLNACSHGGLIEQGNLCLSSIAIAPEFDLVLAPDHFSCVIDLLGRAGCIEEAVMLGHKMPFRPSSVTWHSVMAACKKSGDVENARLAFDHAIQEDPMDSTAYVSLSNVVATAATAQTCQ